MRTAVGDPAKPDWGISRYPAESFGLADRRTVPDVGGGLEIDQS